MSKIENIAENLQIFFQKNTLLPENGFQSGSSSCESDASSPNSSDSNLDSDEIDQENHSDCSNNSMNKKSSKTIDQKKNPKISTQKEKTASPPLEQKNLNDENSNQSLNFSKSAREKMSEVKSEIDMQSQAIALPSLLSNEEIKHARRYCFDSETKNSKTNIDKFKMENEDEYMKHLDKDVIKCNSSTKRSTSANNSPYKEKKRKFFFDKTDFNHEFMETGTTHLEANAPHKPVVKTVYYSYFEHGCDERDEIREIK